MTAPRTTSNGLFDKTILPKAIRSLLPKKLPDEHLLLWWAAFEQGREYEREVGHRQINRNLERLHQRLDNMQTTAPAAPAAPKRAADAPRPAPPVLDHAAIARSAEEPVEEDGSEPSIGRYSSRVVSNIVEAILFRIDSTQRVAARAFIRKRLAEMEPTSSQPQVRAIVIELKEKKLLQEGEHHGEPPPEQVTAAARKFEIDDIMEMA